MVLTQSATLFRGAPIFAPSRPPRAQEAWPGACQPYSWLLGSSLWGREARQVPESKAFSYHHGNGALGHPWSWILSLVAPTPQVCSTWQRTLFMNPGFRQSWALPALLKKRDGAPLAFPGLPQGPNAQPLQLWDPSLLVQSLRTTWKGRWDLGCCPLFADQETGPRECPGLRALRART